MGKVVWKAVVRSIWYHPKYLKGRHMILIQLLLVLGVFRYCDPEEQISNLGFW